jgi:hypothetical protein
MSPVSRGRRGKQNKRSTRLRRAADPCDCPSCSGADVDPRQLIDELVAGAAELVGSADPLDAEIMGATFMSMGAPAGEVFEEALIGGFIPQFEAAASTESLAMLLATGSVAPGQAAKSAWAAAERLAEAGVAAPKWAAELSEPLTVGDCWRLSDPQGTASILVCSFRRAGRSHAAMISVDHLECGAARHIQLLDVDHLPEVLEMLKAGITGQGLEVAVEALDPAEFRWHAEQALDARAVHDAELADEEREPPFNEDGPGYPVFAVLLRARMDVLPVPSKPPAPHGGTAAPRFELPALKMLAQLASTGRTKGAALPPKRKKAGGPAPVYQIKVGLRGAKPPIWRRLEVPADISLARLHTVIQIAFGWDDSHLHVFETPYGRFGAADADLGHRAEAPVTLEQVAPAVNSMLRYTYDFGDDWEHEIRVEKELPRDGTEAYPRCTGGRRAGPPEDCGGIWGYAELVNVLSDPAHPEHQDRLEWLGLDDAADFDPNRFDAGTITRALSRLR